MIYPLRLSLCLVLLHLSACSHLSQGVVVDADRSAAIPTYDQFGDSAARVVYPKQNWSSATSLWFYNTSQGSNLLPYDIFLHLEQHDSNVLFRSDDNMRRFRYLVQKPSWDNRDGLPVGWVKDTYQDQTYVGFTCAACHTAQINYRGAAIRIDGAPTLSDMELMLKELSLALAASVNNEARFQRLARNILGNRYPDGVRELRAVLVNADQQFRTYNRVNAPLHGTHEIAYGYGRLDAFGRIYNRVLAHLTPEQENANPANAPVSYPHLWDTVQHDFVQWNGVADNAGDGPLRRNTGEAIGVFATFDLQKKLPDGGYRSSVNVRNLIRLERKLSDLWSPRWEELADQQVLPKINTALARQGEQVYIDYQCHTCHRPIERTDPSRRIIAQHSSLKMIGTDPFMAKNALAYTGKSGLLQGQPMGRRAPEPNRFAETTPALPALSEVTARIILEPDHDKTLVRRWAEKLYDRAMSLTDNPIGKTERHLDFEVVNKHDPATLMAYKARPLNGIWATAPYLHNGSVPNLYELFLPSCSDAEIAEGKACRSNRFTLGSLELDPVKVGFVERDPARYPGLFIFDTRLPGNSNRGHEYTAGITPVFTFDGEGKPARDSDGKPILKKLEPITEQQRLALVEYLKTL